MGASLSDLPCITLLSSKVVVEYYKNHPNDDIMDNDNNVIVLQNVLAYDGGRPDEVFWERNHHKIH